MDGRQGNGELQLVARTAGRNVNRSTSPGRWNVGGAFRPCTCNIINRLIGHEYTHSANEYTHLSVWDSPAKGAPTALCGPQTAVSAHLVVWHP